MYKDQHQTKRLFGTDPTMGLFVALYLILLAFFILMNAVSTHAASKASEAMESVHSTFHLANQPKNRPTIDPSAQDIPSNDLTLKAISRVFYTEMEISGRYSKAGGNVFEVEFPADYLFERGSMRVRKSMHPFLDQILAAVKSQGDGRKQLAFMFGVGTAQVDREITRSQEIAIRRAGSLARYLQEKGISDGDFATGFVAIPEGMVLAAFHTAPVLRGGEL